jgi:hypothetical protein
METSHCSMCSYQVTVRGPKVMKNVDCTLCFYTTLHLRSSKCGAKPVGFGAWWLKGGKRQSDREVHIINTLPSAISKGLSLFYRYIFH